jgi:hypothetical protein
MLLRVKVKQNGKPLMRIMFSKLSVLENFKSKNDVKVFRKNACDIGESC